MNNAKAFKSLEEIKKLKSFLLEKGMSYRVVWIRSDD